MSEKEEIEGLDEKDVLWNSAGMHRPIASFWYNYVFLLIAAIPGILIVGWLIPSVLMPDPASLGIGTVVTSYFQFLFVMFDVGTGLAIERFIAEHAYKDPKRTLKYLQFFSWFQLFTGLMQTTIIAIYVMISIINGGEAFLAWPFLIYSLTQYPGMLGVYKHALAAFQQHGKQIIVELFQNVLFQSLTQIGFILLFRWWGTLNPYVGESMGAAIGYIVGSYIDDFLGMVLGAWYFSRVIKPLNLSISDTLRPGFSVEIAKEVIIYGLKVLPAYAVNAGVTFIVLRMTMEWMPNYTHIVAIVSLANAVATVTSISFTITPAISESYNNGYEALTQYYIKQQWKHWALIAMFLFVAVYMVVPPVFRVLAGDYALAADILGVLMVTRLIVFPINFGSSISQGINKPEYQTYALFLEQGARAFSFFFFLNPWWGMVTVFGAEYALWFYVFADFPAYCVKLIAQWAFVKRTIKWSVAPSFYQTFIAPLLTAIPLVFGLWLPLQIFNYVVKISGNDLLIPAITIGLILLGGLFLYPFLILFPVYGLVGGWDDASLEAFEKAARITGPSRIFVKLMAKFSRWGHEHSPVKNRFPIDYSKAEPQVEILTKKRINLYLEEQEDDE